MFKKFFDTIRNKAKNLWASIKNSKVVKIAGKVVKFTCSACIIITAFNTGNIMESLSHLQNAPATLGDTFRWFFVLCKDWAKNVKELKFTWDVKQIFIPLCIATSYVGSKIVKFGISAFKFVKRLLKLNAIEEKKAKEPEIQVVDVFA